MKCSWLVGNAEVMGVLQRFICHPETALDEMRSAASPRSWEGAFGLGIVSGLPVNRKQSQQTRFAPLHPVGRPSHNQILELPGCIGRPTGPNPTAISAGGLERASSQGYVILSHCKKSIARPWLPWGAHAKSAHQLLQRLLGYKS
jgi:hypothetical protein